MDSKLCLVLVAALASSVTSLRIPKPNGEGVKVVDEADNQAPCFCRLNFDPVCGSDGNSYSNECSLKCAGKHLTVDHQGTCETNPTIANVPSVQGLCSCPRNSKPVCGSDGETYENQCLLECTGKSISVRHSGPCGEEVKVVDIALPQDKCTCTRNYRPVCGNDGVTYGNQCVMRCAGQGLKFDGPCDGNQVRVVE